MVDQAYSLREMMRNKKAAEAQPSTLMVAVASGKGGVGKSLFTLNLAISLQNRGQRVLVIDADFGLSNLDIMLGITPKFNLAHVLKHECTIEDAVTHCQNGIMVISGGSGLEELTNLDELAMNTLMRAFLRIQDSADIILFDMGAGVSDRVVQVISACQKVIIVTTPEPTAILDAYALLKTLNTEERLPEIRLVVNRADSLQEGRNMLEKFTQVSQKYLGVEVKPLGIIPYDASAREAIKNQSPLVELHPKGPASLAIGKIADDFLGQRSPENREQSGIALFFSRLLQRKPTQEHGG